MKTIKLSEVGIRSPKKQLRKKSNNLVETEEEAVHSETKDIVTESMEGVLMESNIRTSDYVQKKGCRDWWG